MDTYRTLFDAASYTPFIASPDSTTTELGEGDTKMSIDLMKYWTLQHFKQVEKLAPKLRGRTLEETVKNIKYWAYHAIQYKKDGAIQYLRSPARAWRDRYLGSDCKTYSILVSSILLNLGIIHYFRMIKQLTLKPQEFTHVYVVVPLDQQTGSLNSGHYAIDATIESMKEPLHIEKYDIMMHIGLNGVEMSGVNTPADDYVPFYEAETIEGLNCACQQPANGLGTMAPPQFSVFTPNNNTSGYDWNNFTSQIGNVFNTGIQSYFSNQNARQNAKANEITAQAQLAAAQAKAKAEELKSQTDLLVAQTDKEKAAQAAALERLKLENAQKNKSGNKALVIAGVITGTFLIGGMIYISTRKKSKK